MANFYFFESNPKDNSEECNDQLASSVLKLENNPINPKCRHKEKTAIAKKLSVTFIRIYSPIFG